MVRLESLAPSLKRRFQALFGSRVEVLWFAGCRPDPIQGDVVWVEDIVFEMAFRAQTAVPYGGRLVVDWANVRLDDTGCELGLAAGRYVMIEISCIRQNPSDMAAESGFSVVYPKDLCGCDLTRAEHMILSLGGRLSEYNEPGRALTLRAFFPSLPADDAIEQDSDVTDELVRPLILIVEDENFVRNVAFEILEAEGYQVLTARTGKEAIAVCAEKGPIHLLVTDLIMPGMDGERLSTELRALNPEMKTIYMSGYSDTWLARFNQDEMRRTFLPKPFTLEALTQKVREVLGGQA